MPAPYRCPANGERCGQRCLLRHDCARDPERVLALTDRLNEQTALAMAELAMAELVRKRRLRQRASVRHG